MEVGLCYTGDTGIDSRQSGDNLKNIDPSGHLVYS